MDDIIDISDTSSENSLEVPLSKSQHDFINQLQHNTENRVQDSIIERPDINEPISDRQIDAKANYINLLLTANGYPVPIIFKDPNEKDTIKLLDSFQTVLQDIKKYQDERDQLNEIIQELKQEQQSTQKQLDQSMSDLDTKERELAKAKIKIESTNEQLKKETENNRLIKEELSKAKNNMQYMKSQYAHETRRHEQEHAKTRERLNKLMREKLKTNVISMSINTKSVIEELDMVPERDAIEDERAMQKDLIQKTTTRERKILMESEQLKTVAVKIYNSVRRLLENQLELYEESFGNIESHKQVNQDVAKYFLPTEFNGDDITNQVNDLLDRLQKEWDRQITDRKIYTEEEVQEKDQTIENYLSQVVQLEKTIEKIQQEYEQKEKIYLKFAKGGFFDDDIAKSHTFNLSESEESVVEDEDATLRLKYYYNKAKKQQEKVTEIAINLGDERSKLEAERWAFEEIKRQTKLMEIMDDIPTTSNDNKRRKLV